MATEAKFKEFVERNQKVFNGVNGLISKLENEWAGDELLMLAVILIDTGNRLLKSPAVLASTGKGSESVN